MHFENNITKVDSYVCNKMKMQTGLSSLYHWMNKVLAHHMRMQHTKLQISIYRRALVSKDAG